MPKPFAAIGRLVSASFGAALLLGVGSAAAAEIAVTQYGTSLYGAPFTVAQAHGLFKKGGVDIDGFNGSAGGGTTVRNIMASPLPYGEVSLGAAIAAKRHGLDIVMVNVGTRSVAESSLLTMPNSPIKTLGDLVGKKVAVTSPRGSSEMILMMELKAQGIDPAKVQRIASGGYVNSLTMLEQGAVAAAGEIEPLSIIHSKDYRTLVRAADTLPPMTTSVGITTSAYAKTHREQIQAIIAARRTAVDQIYADPKGTAELLSREYKLDPHIASVAVDNMVKVRMWSPGDFNMDELDRTMAGLRLTGELEGAFDITTMIDKSFLPQDLQAKK